MSSIMQSFWNHRLPNLEQMTNRLQLKQSQPGRLIGIAQDEKLDVNKTLSAHDDKFFGLTVL